MTRRQGFTLIEAMVAYMLLAILFLMMFFIYRTGASAWKKAEAQTQLLQEAQVVTGRLSREIERSVYASAGLDPGPGTGTAVAFLSCWNDATGEYDYDPGSRSPLWHKYLICYYNAATQEVFWTETPLVPPSSTPAPLAALATFRNGGKLLARNVTRCDFTLSEDMLELQLELSRKRYGSETLEVVQLPLRVFFRN